MPDDYVQSMSVDHVALRVPDFYEAGSEMWFGLLERKFATIGIISEAIKLNYFAGTLPPR